ncbi:MAG: DUF523 domain-containing protein [Bacilli bacterium]|nr:DUF523 domain-containing protein [Bacilli bacterium]
MIKYAISACLCGFNCKYNGKNNLNAKCQRLLEMNEAIIICPEVMGGLNIPRKPCEINGHRIINIDGKDCSKEYYDGALMALEYIKKFKDIDTIILKEKSPSCGVKYIYDGTFSKTLIKGSGITTSLLKEQGYKVISEEDLDEL